MEQEMTALWVTGRVQRPPANLFARLARLQYAVCCWVALLWIVDGQAAPVAALTGVTEHALTPTIADPHGCAIVEARLWCWGSNRYGQLGRVTQEIVTNTVSGPLTAWSGQPLAMPVTAQDIRVESIRVAANVTCWLSNARLYCAGDPRYLPTADLSPGATWQSAAWNALYDDVRDVRLSATGGCTIDTRGTVACWGQNRFGGTGSPATESTNVQSSRQPVADAPAGVRKLLVGAEFACALANGAVWCWGRNDLGQLGDGTTTPRHKAKAVVGLPQTITDIAAGDDGHVCALATEGTLWCWGNNYAGQVGVAPTAEERWRTLPTRVATLQGGAVSRMNLGYGSTCVEILGEALCFGVDADGRTSTLRPPVRTPNGAPRGWLGGCFLAAGGALHCPYMSGTYPYTALSARKIANVAELIGTPTEIKIGRSVACARNRDSALACWGANAFGQLGQGDTNARVGAVRLPFALRDFAVGADHACAADATGVACWGRNDFGALGDGTTVHRTVPTRAIGYGRRVAAGGNTTCAYDSPTLNLRCWGRNSSGQASGDPADSVILQPASPLPTSVMLSSAGGVVLGESFACATFSRSPNAPSETACWGYLELDPGSNNTLPAGAVRTFRGGTALPDGGPYLRSSAFTVCAGDRCAGKNLTPATGDTSTAWGVVLSPSFNRNFTLGGRHACALPSAAATTVGCRGLSVPDCGYRNFTGRSFRIIHTVVCDYEWRAAQQVTPPWESVLGLPGIPTSIAVGYETACAIVGRDVWCWGDTTSTSPSMLDQATGFDERDWHPIHRESAVAPSGDTAVPLDTTRACPAYVAARVTPLGASTAGAWGLELLARGGRLQLHGGVNFSAVGHMPLDTLEPPVPGYAAFSIQNPRGGPQNVVVTLFGEGEHEVLVQSTVPPSLLRTTVLRQTVTLSTVSTRRQLSLPDGFHILVVQPLSGTRGFRASVVTTQPDGTPAALHGGVVVGGYMAQGLSGDAGLCTDDASQFVFATQGLEARGFGTTDNAKGAGDLRLMVTEAQSGKILYDSWPMP
jgi:alpha-tubulin suppressor-like RCC1 family protein